MTMGFIAMIVILIVLANIMYSCYSSGLIGQGFSDMMRS